MASDVRCLFPKEYADAASPILHSFAFREDGKFIGAYVRFLESKEHHLRENGAAAAAATSSSTKEERNLAQSLHFPMGRLVTTGNRREAGVYLRHIADSGPTASEIVSTTL